MADDKGVEVAPRALGDARFAHLAQLLGLASPRHAIGEMVFIWDACRVRRERVLPDDAVRAILGPDGPKHLVAAGLGEPVLGGGVRVRGVDQYVRWKSTPAAAGQGKPRAAMDAAWTEEEKRLAGEVLDYLSSRGPVKYKRDAPYNVRYVVRLLRAGHTLKEIQRVVWHRCLKWADDEKMQEWLRPKTIFGPDNFANYLPQAEAEIARLKSEQETRARADERPAAPLFNGGGE